MKVDMANDSQLKRNHEKKKKKWKGLLPQDCVALSNGSGNNETGI